MAMSAFSAVLPVSPKNVAFDGSIASLLTAYWDPMEVLTNPHTANPLLCSTINPNQAVCQDVIPESMRVGTNLAPFATPWCTGEPLTKDTGVKKSAWLQRRTTVLQEGASLGEVMPVHISDKFMHADAFIKYLAFDKWQRHMDYILNRTRALLFGT